MKDNNIHTLLTVAVFIFLFMSIGWFAPAMYASYAPEDRFIEVNQFEPANATVDSDSHAICWDTDVHKETAGEVIMELYLLDKEGVELEVDTIFFRTYFEEDSVSAFEVPLPEKELPSGEYEYRAVITMHLAADRVERDFSWESDNFYLKENTTEQSYC